MTVKLSFMVTFLILLFSGCAQTAPDLAGNNNISGTDAISGNTVTIDENTYGNEKGKYNSSSDGFKSVYFDFAKYVVSPSMEANMRSNVQVASMVASKIKIEGNCDEFGTDEYNYALGLKRAKAVKDSLVAQGIAASNMIMVSFGESNPVCQTPSDSCYDRNRRVDIRLVK